MHRSTLFLAVTIEIKMLRLVGDNGKPNDKMLMHILSPYETDRSALTDCHKLVASGFANRKAVIIYGFDYPDLPMDPAINAFGLLASQDVQNLRSARATYSDLVHPVHREGRVLGWETGPITSQQGFKSDALLM